jgi:hypothetical protein
VRLGDDERHRRLCEAIPEVLYLSAGWLSRAQLRDGLGQGWRGPDELSRALAELLAQGAIVAKKRRKGVGRHGREATVYGARTARLVLADEQRETGDVSPAIALDPIARAALFDYASARFLAARADVDTSLEDERFWRTTALALRGSEDSDEPTPADTDAEATR